MIFNLFLQFCIIVDEKFTTVDEFDRTHLYNYLSLLRLAKSEIFVTESSLNTVDGTRLILPSYYIKEGDPIRNPSTKQEELIAQTFRHCNNLFTNVSPQFQMEHIPQEHRGEFQHIEHKLEKVLLNVGSTCTIGSVNFGADDDIRELLSKIREFLTKFKGEHDENIERMSQYLEAIEESLMGLIGEQKEVAATATTTTELRKKPELRAKPRGEILKNLQNLQSKAQVETPPETKKPSEHYQQEEIKNAINGKF